MKMTEENRWAIRVDDLTVAYDYKPVLWDVDLKIPEGILMAVVGPNGAGKSTLIKSILGIIKPIAGSVTIFGKPYQQQRRQVAYVHQKESVDWDFTTTVIEEELEGSVTILGKPYQQQRRQVAYVTQKESVDWDFPTTVIDVVLMGTYGKLGWIRRPGSKERKEATEALEKVGMLSFKNRQISQLSGGQQQRVFLARALVQDAAIYFMDEPFQGVDATTEVAIINILKELRKAGKILIVVHHDLQTVPEYFDWVTFLNVKEIATGPVKDVFNDDNLTKSYVINYKVAINR